MWEGHPVDQQVEAQPGQGGGHRTVTRCRDDSLDAVPEGTRRVQHPQRQELPFRELQVRVKPAGRGMSLFLGGGEEGETTQQADASCLKARTLL